MVSYMWKNMTSERLKTCLLCVRVLVRLRCNDLLNSCLQFVFVRLYSLSCKNEKRCKHRQIVMQVKFGLML